MSIQSDNDYKPDIEIMDRYINFSAELLRISLLAIGGFGAIILIKLKSQNNTISIHHLLFLLFPFAVLPYVPALHSFIASVHQIACRGISRI